MTKNYSKGDFKHSVDFKPELFCPFSDKRMIAKLQPYDNT